MPAPAVFSFLDNPDPALAADGLLHQIFADSARRHGQRTALECEGRRLSYEELDAASNQFARQLRARGVVAGDRVCLLLNKSPELYTALLGILKAGAAYVPLDPSYPPERARFIAADCGAVLLVTSLEFLPVAGKVACPKLYWNEARHEIAGQSPSSLPCAGGPQDEAYVIYTSGTTGNPKGVAVSHGSASHLARAEAKVYQVRAEDRVLQGFSAAFDASVEEMWAAWSAGAALVAGTAAVMHSGPDLGRRLCELGITVFSTVPTLLALLPEPAACVRLLILGGEALPAELVRPWLSPERRVYNTYGPTETTVVATLALCRPGAPVTIGRPLANYTAYICDQRGGIVERGREGELLIGGPGVAKGYLNREELTAAKFIGNPHQALTGDASPVLYRTGDLARINADGDIEFLGRVDTQVKIRGYRVELAEIESLLRELPGVRNAAALVQESPGGSVLGAYVELAAGAAFDEGEALAGLKRRLPPYSVPLFVEPLREFPTLASGKVDRKSFPPPKRKVVAGRRPDFGSPLKNAVYEAWSRLFENEQILETDNFFTDLGGHSLLAARFVSEMRREQRFAGLALSDLYANPSIRELGLYLERQPAARPAAAPAAFRSLPMWQYRLSAAAQAVMLYFSNGFFALQWITPFMAYSFMRAYERPYWESLLIAFLSLCFVYPLMLLLGIGAKWLILGRVREGDYPIWGAYYLRWLMVQRLLAAVPLHFLAGTPLMARYLRLLGSKVGKDAYIDSYLVSGLDLLAIGDQASINAEANISTYSLEDGLLKLRRVEIGAGVSVGARSVVGPDTMIGAGTAIGDLSCIRSGARVGPGQYWSGSPAVPGEKPPAPGASPAAGQGSVPDALAAAFYVASFFLLPALGLLPIFPGIMLMYHMDLRTEHYAYLLLAPLVAVVFVALSALQILALKWLILGRLKEGVYRIKSFFYMRKWVLDKLMENSRELLQTLYATLYLNPWYRALGANVGADAEISTASFILPDLLHIGAGSFIADGAGLGPAKVVGGEIILRKTEVGTRTFIGNSAFVPVGSRLGSNCLLGCQSIPPGEDTPDGTSWLGSPAVNLPQRQKPAKQFAEERTYHPTRKLYAQRLGIEFFRVILPATAFVVFTTLMLSFAVQMEDLHGPVPTVLAFPAVYMAFGVVAMLLTALMKHAIVGRHVPDEQPLWSPFVWRTELMTGFCENFTNEFFVSQLEGTVFLPWYYRLLGMTVGRRACLLTTDFTEFDLVALGDDVALNEDCTIQTHLFEDRVMKLGKVEIGSRVSIGSNTVVLYDSAIEDDVKVGDLSLLMKGERLRAGSRWAGSPLQSGL
ncbi:MAG: amino acid adenylation domain-containing protein [Elusimicrobia bacterium]|nr:amino acid adenylation domain-containing protein [Elusimicrobiota bacterium]